MLYKGVGSANKHMVRLAYHKLSQYSIHNCTKTIILASSQKVMNGFNFKAFARNTG